MKTKKSTDKNSSTFDYSALKTVANDHEREGRWAEAAKVWTAVVEQSTNKMIIDNAKRRAKTAHANAADAADDTQATPRVVSAPVEEVGPGRESDAPTANDARDGAPVEEAARPTPPPANVAPTGEPGASDAPTVDRAAKAPMPRDARLPESAL